MDKAANVVPLSEGGKRARRTPRLPGNLPVSGKTVIIPGEVRENSEDYRKIGEQVTLQIDETPVDYIAPGHGQVKEGRFWVYHNPELGVLYDWQTSRFYRVGLLP